MLHVTFLLLAIVIILGSLASFKQSVHAEGDEIEVLAVSAESDFPNGVRFFIEAESPDEIDSIRVFFKKMGQTSRSSYRAVEFQAGTAISGESLLLSGRGGEYIPPGTRIEYFFEIRDTADRVFRTEPKTLVYLDETLDWQTLTDGLVTVYYEGDDADQRADKVLKSAQLSLGRMRPVLGIEPSDPLHIITYSNYADMSRALPFRAQAVTEQLITQGMAFGEERVLLVYGFAATVENTTTHEFTHLLVADAAGRMIGQVPAWLNEGLAEYSTGTLDVSFARSLEAAIARGEVRPLWHQKTFSGTPSEIITAYGQGNSVVTYLIDTYGVEKIGEMLVALKGTLDMDSAMQQVYDFDQRGLDAQWRIFLGLEPLPPEPEPQSEVDPAATARPLPPTIAPVSAATPKSPPESAVSNVNPDGRETAKHSPGCNAPAHGAAVVTDLAMLLLLGGPLAMIGMKTFGG